MDKDKKINELYAKLTCEEERAEYFEKVIIPKLEEKFKNQVVIAEGEVEIIGNDPEVKIVYVGDKRIDLLLEKYEGKKVKIILEEE